MATYSDNQNHQILLAFLKEYGIKKVVASPGGTNPAMVISFQSDNFFEMYSSVDERSAAYMACGLSEASGEPVIICCTGATASRNYMSALTEAYYKKLPIVVITCSRPNFNLGHLMPQVTNRNQYPADILVKGEHIQLIKDKKDIWDVEVKINRGLMALTQHGGGPIHFNLECYSQTCTTNTLPSVHITKRIDLEQEFPPMVDGNVAIFVGSHKSMDEELIQLIDEFCENYNAVVLSDHTSGYKGKYSIPFALIGTQEKHKFDIQSFNLLIHLGNISGDYPTFENITADNIWRVSEDGELRIRFNHLEYLFEMTDKSFFRHYHKERTGEKIMPLFEQISNIYDELYESIPELPFSHIYIAKKMAPLLPKNSVVHFAILNSLRSWNFFKIDGSIVTNSNVGGFGIDGCTSTLIGASLANKDKLHFLFTGDLAFFYDMNSLGNRHLGNNVRIMLLNDGKGAEFCHYKFPKYVVDRELFVAASGHFGKQSKNLVKHYAEDLGFEYIHASTKEEFIDNIECFVSSDNMNKPILFEVFADVNDQSEAWRILSNLSKGTIGENAKRIAKSSAIKVVSTIFHK